MQGFGDVPYDLEIVNLGSTFAKHGFDYRYFGRHGFNLAGQPQPLKEDREILERYQDHLRPGAIVIAAVCPFGFSRYDYADIRQPGLIGRVSILARKGIRKVTGYDKAEREKFERLPVEERSRRVAQSRVDGWKREFSLADTTTIHPDEEMRRMFAKTRKELRSILLLCRERGFRPVVINMPAAEAECSLFSEMFIREFYEENVDAANVTGAPVFSYFGDGRFKDPLLYENYADCLNDAGRRMFAGVLIGDLRASGLWG